MHADNDLLPISALQHLAFCERQCALIHVEREWEDNERTAEGNVLHAKVDEGYKTYRKGVRQFASVPVRSVELGIAGRLDVVELVKVGDTPDNCAFLKLDGSWEAHPVEFKRGKPKLTNVDRVQLCAQALCLEEMTAQAVNTGSLFYGQSRRREEISIDSELRDATKRLIARLREIIESSLLPPPVYKRHCRSCSLERICQPRFTSGTRTTAYRKELLG